MKKILPLIMLLIGAGAGVGAGVYLRPAPDENVEADQEKEELKSEEQKAEPKQTKIEDEVSGVEGMQYIKLSNQFVVPIVKDERVASMVVMTLSVEVPDGLGQEVYDLEPKIRDVFLRVLFDHATIGAFDGAFLNNGNLDVIRRSLREIAHKVFGAELINDVLIFEIARQDY